MPAPEICFQTAAELARRVRGKELSALEVVEAHLEQIERVNPEVNAIVTLTAEDALDRARATDDALARDEEVGALAGLPVAHKDLFPTEGVRTTFGSADLRGLRPRPRRADRGAAEGGRGHLRRQDEHAGVRRRLADLQRGLRRDAQPLRPDEDVRREQRRGGGGPGVRDGADRRRQRHGRLPAQPGELLQRGRLQAVARQGAELAGSHAVAHAHGGRTRWPARSRTWPSC